MDNIFAYQSIQKTIQTQFAIIETTHEHILTEEAVAKDK